VFWAAHPGSKAAEPLPLTKIAITSGSAEQVGRCANSLGNLVAEPAVPQHEEPPRLVLLRASGDAAGIEIPAHLSSGMGYPFKSGRPSYDLPGTPAD
jgi:hypothetical protein